LIGSQDVNLIIGGSRLNPVADLAVVHGAVNSGGETKLQPVEACRLPAGVFADV
jgi:hypothetical protein